MFKIGQQVVCVDNSPVRADCTTAMPLRLKKDAVYTIRSIHTEPDLPGYGVRLIELENPSVVWSNGEEKEWSYAAWRFRPLVLDETALERAAQSGGQRG